jgi:hypothetical protein
VDGEAEEPAQAATDQVATAQGCDDVGAEPDSRGVDLDEEQ